MRTMRTAVISAMVVVIRHYIQQQVQSV